MDEWTKHTGTEKPDELADAQIVEVYEEAQLNGQDIIAPPMQGEATARDFPWHDGIEYCATLDPDGIPYCSSSGLEDWAEYVATDMDGTTIQYSAKPKWKPWRGFWVRNGMDDQFKHDLAPESHHKPGPAEQSLMRVWRMT